LVVQKEQYNECLAKPDLQKIKVRVSQSALEAYRLTHRDRLVESVTLEAIPSPSAVRVVYGRRRGGRSFGADWQFIVTFTRGTCLSPALGKA
jgi:hypothetical protein